MNKLILALSFMALMVVNSTEAQDIKLPKSSPKSSTSYVIGLTEVKVEYSAPAVKERTIWGDLVPYGEVWRAGANEATTVEFSTDVNMEGQTLRAGKYALFFIPGEREWTVIFNRKHNQWGAYNYDENEDEIRFNVEPRMNEGMQERLTYSIHDMKMDMGYIKLAWEKMRLYMRFKTDVMEQAMANIIDALASSPPEKQWVIYAQGAEFLMEANENLSQALEWAKKSTDLRTHSWNWYIRAKAEALNGDMMAAVTSGTKCAEIGLADENDKYYEENQEEINASIQSWAAKMN